MKSKSFIIITVIWVFVFVVVLGIVIPGPILFGQQFDLSKASSIGNYWSGLGSYFFNGITIWLIYITYKLQIDQAEDNRINSLNLLNNQQQQLEESRQNNISQLKIQHQDRFDTWFFLILSKIEEKQKIISMTFRKPYFDKERDVEYLKTNEATIDLISRYSTLHTEAPKHLIFMLNSLVDAIQSKNLLQTAESLPYYLHFNNIDLVSDIIDESIKRHYLLWIARGCVNNQKACEKAHWLTANSFFAVKDLNQLPLKYSMVIKGDYWTP